MERVFYIFFQLFDLLLFLLPKLLLFFLAFFLYLWGKYYSLKNISYKRYFTAEGVFEGEDTQLVEEVANRSFLPVFRTDIESLFSQNLSFYGLSSDSDSGLHTFLSRFTIMPFTTIRRTHRLNCKKRGTYQLETAQIIFMKKVFVLPSKATLFVYPKQLSVSFTQKLNYYLASVDASPLPLFSDVFSFSGIRSYQPGDSFHSINFKATARHNGDIYVNQTDFFTGKRQMIYLNFETNPTYSTQQYRQYMETALSYCAYLLDKAVSGGYEIGFAANCKLFHGKKYLRYPLSAFQKADAYKEILKQMADVQISRGQSIASLLSMDLAENVHHAQILLFTLTMDDRTEDAIKRLEACENQVQIVWLSKV